MHFSLNQKREKIKLKKYLYLIFIIVCFCANINMFSCSQTTSDSPAFDDDFMKSKTLETTIDLKKNSQTATKSKDNTNLQPAVNKNAAQADSGQDIPVDYTNTIAPTSSPQEITPEQQVPAAPSMPDVNPDSVIKKKKSLLKFNDFYDNLVLDDSPGQANEYIPTSGPINKDNFFIVGLFGIVFFIFAAFLILKAIKSKFSGSNQAEIYHQDISSSNRLRSEALEKYGDKQNGIEIVKNSSAAAVHKIERELPPPPPPIVQQIIEPEPVVSKEELSEEIEEANKIFEQQQPEIEKPIGEEVLKTIAEKSGEELEDDTGFDSLTLDEYKEEDGMFEDDLAYIKGLNKTFEENTPEEEAQEPPIKEEAIESQQEQAQFLQQEEIQTEEELLSDDDIFSFAQDASDLMEDEQAVAPKESEEFYQSSEDEFFSQQQIQEQTLQEWEQDELIQEDEPVYQAQENILEEEIPTLSEDFELQEESFEPIAEEENIFAQDIKGSDIYAEYEEEEFHLDEEPLEELSLEDSTEEFVLTEEEPLVEAQENFVSLESDEIQSLQIEDEPMFAIEGETPSPIAFGDGGLKFNEEETAWNEDAQDLTFSEQPEQEEFIFENAEAASIVEEETLLEQQPDEELFEPVSAVPEVNYDEVNPYETQEPVLEELSSEQQTEEPEKEEIKPAVSYARSYSTPDELDVVDGYKINENKTVYVIKNQQNYSLVSYINSQIFNLLNLDIPERISKVKELDEKRNDKQVYMLKTENRRALIAMSEEEAEFIMEL